MKRQMQANQSLERTAIAAVRTTSSQNSTSNLRPTGRFRYGRPLSFIVMRLNPIAFGIITAAAFIAHGCGLFDSGIEWKAGPYVLMWIDDSSNTEVYRNEGNGCFSGRIDQTVYSVGWNDRYLVAKQHPKGDKTITNYFIIDSTKDKPLGNAKQCVTGPLSKAEFHTKSKELTLPQFTKTLAALE